MRDVVIIGSGCAGNTAAIYAARANLKPLVITGHEAGGQLSLTSLVENFPGFPEGINGPDLVENMKLQAIADQTGASLGTVKSRLHYALRCLERELPAELNLMTSQDTHNPTSP